MTTPSVALRYRTRELKIKNSVKKKTATGFRAVSNGDAMQDDRRRRNVRLSLKAPSEVEVNKI